MSFEEFLKYEENSEVKHEFVDGEIYSMAGATWNHCEIAGNFFGQLWSHLRGKPCRAFQSDMLVRLQLLLGERGYYPDVVVSCNPADRGGRYVQQPTVVVEVLSPSTERLDRREKLDAYRSVASLQEYVLVSQHMMEVTLMERSKNWAPLILGADERLHLPSIGFETPIAHFYEGVTFESEES